MLNAESVKNFQWKSEILQIIKFSEFDTKESIYFEKFIFLIFIFINYFLLCLKCRKRLNNGQDP